ncbi:glycosyltransferase [Acinetobacter courvalinii]|uniref:glycosyltransferase n=1 Tax=Acinetobacter courvalinii TaxID=280147 RepID=UPI0021D35E05|nr:glycosyltransferase [Acinetobacter courvalinii]MCU4640927.1 glycosyl transferase family 1 [Acinetobacter courvalinii]
MKILMLAPYSSPIVQRLVKALEMYSECEIWVASFNVETDLEKKIIGLGEINSFIDYFKFYKVNKLVKKINPDIVHAHIINHYGVMAIFQKKPLLVGLWGSDVMLAPKKGSLIKRSIFKLINKIVVIKADKLHTSSSHILDELVLQYGEFVKNKTDVFYWGFPVEKPSDISQGLIERNFKQEFDICSNDRLIVFPRGVSSVYDPDGVIKIIKKISNIKEFKIVVLRGFSSDKEVEKFKENLGVLNKKIIFINRLLNAEELYVLYGQSKFHISVPISDALGGGVVEPYLRGSFPILSNLLPYEKFVNDNHGFVLKDYSEKSLNNLEKTIFHENFQENDFLSSTYSANSIVSKFTELYKNTLK